MRKEINEVEIDETLPRITVPPDKLKEKIRNHDLHPSIASEPLELFENGHFNESVRKAMEKFEDRVQEISALEAYGHDLMAKAFKDNSNIDLSEVEPENQSGFTDGYKLLTMGAMSCIRNIFSHGDEERRHPEECFEMLLFVNWLFRALKEENS